MPRLHARSRLLESGLLRPSLLGHDSWLSCLRGGASSRALHFTIKQPQRRPKPTRTSRGPTHIFNWREGVRGIFWGLQFWPKGIFFGSMKNAGIFWGLRKNHGFFGYCTLHLAQINNNTNRRNNLLLVWDILGFAKNMGIFRVDKLWSLDFYGYKIWTSVGAPRN